MQCLKLLDHFTRGSDVGSSTSIRDESLDRKVERALGRSIRASGNRATGKSTTRDALWAESASAVADQSGLMLPAGRW